MRPGNLNSITLIILISLYSTLLFAETQVDLQNIQPTFEEEPETIDNKKTEQQNYIKSKKRKKIQTDETIVSLRALDKITAKTLDIDTTLGKKKKFGYLEILPKNCKRSLDANDPGFIAYLQVKDLSDKSDEKVFVFNGWTFSSSPTLRPFDHPVYDLWLSSCKII